MQEEGCSIVLMKLTGDIMEPTVNIQVTFFLGITCRDTVGKIPEMMNIFPVDPGRGNNLYAC